MAIKNFERHGRRARLPEAEMGSDREPESAFPPHPIPLPRERGRGSPSPRATSPSSHTAIPSISAETKVTGSGAIGTAHAAYAELHCLSDFSFQRGASSALELFERARTLGYQALAITDEASLAGVVRALEASRKTGLVLIVGSEIRLADGPRLVFLVETQAGYTRLCQLITLGRRRSGKGDYRLTRADVERVVTAPGESGLFALWCPDLGRDDAALEADGRWLRDQLGERLWLAVELHRGPDDAGDLARLDNLGERLGIPRLAAGDVHMHVRQRRPLQDVLTAIRLRQPIATAGYALFPNGERHLRTHRALAAIYGTDLMAAAAGLASRCSFQLDRLHYEYPHELVPAGATAASHLAELTWAGAARRWPDGVPAPVRVQIERELALVAELAYEHFFLTVHDIVAWARGRGILCQGRGSAANSAVCYCLGITAVDPAAGNLLFERFISKERDEPPDIDVDFEHERREEVLQYVFAKYGRERAALAATVITWQAKSALRAVGNALGLARDQLDALSRAFARGNHGAPIELRLAEVGLAPDSPVLRRTLELAEQLIDKPRHLSQHVGGFVISEHPLSTLVPVENAAMAERTVIQWDKDDLETLKLLKVDCLALGMLTCLGKCFSLLRRHGLGNLDLATVPTEDAATYAMIGRGDTVGVFQIESRAQMAMLPRLKPTYFYDLVIEVAIVRPGPIQGGMVHPYLRRRSGEEPVSYESEGVRRVLGRTLGVPIFQEQVMALLQEVADFTPGEADQLRRSMAAWKRHGGLEHFQERIFTGMAKNGYAREFAERIFEQIKGFGSYGFPESHAASFALLAYASSWLKCHQPAAFACALLNSQPMGFYGPAQIVGDLRRHGVAVLPVDVRHSDWDCSLERRHDGVFALRLGMRQVDGLAEAAAQRVVAARAHRAFDDLPDLIERAELDRGARDRLAAAGALRGLAGHRHRARWQIATLAPSRDLFGAGSEARETAVSLRPPSLAADVLADYASQGLSLTAHPVALARAALRRARVLDSRELARCPDASHQRTAGLVTVRQRPQTASGVTFVTLEDEHGSINVVVWRAVAERQRRVLLDAILLGVAGKLEARHGVRHLIAEQLIDYSGLLPRLDAVSRDFH